MTVAPVPASRAPVKPLTDAQRRLDAAIVSSRIVYAIGPAGTGKTWLSCMRAAEALQRGEIERIVFTRPAVEAGESLGFLPGELDEKYEPYIRPIRDALEEKLGTSHMEYLIRKKIIDIRPLAFLRGATVKHAWLLADEMQNATKSQMKMLLTRIGENSKFIINGDPRQTDLPSGQSGLEYSIETIKHIGGVSDIRFTYEDVVRDGICQEIVKAFENP